MIAGGAPRTDDHKLSNPKIPRGRIMIWILFLGTFAISLLAAPRVRSNYLRFARVPAASGLTGAETAQEIMRQAGIHDMEVLRLRRETGDARSS